MTRTQKKTVYFLVDGYEPETSTVNQFYGCHWHEHTCLKSRTKRQELRYKNACQIDWLIKNNGWDTEYNLVSTWDCEKPISKKMWFEKNFSPYPHFIVYDLEARLVPFNEHPTGDLTYLSRHIEISVAVHDTLAKEELVYLVDKNPECLVQRFIEAVTEAKSNSCRCFEAVSISLRFPNAS